jgi:hypothetical protein
MAGPMVEEEKAAAEGAIHEIVSWGTERKPDVEQDIGFVGEFVQGSYGLDVVECYIPYLLNVCGYPVDYERDITEPLWRNCSAFKPYFEDAVREHEGEEYITDIEYYGVSLDTLKSYCRASADPTLKAMFTFMYLSCFRFIEISSDEADELDIEEDTSDSLGTTRKQVAFLKAGWQKVQDDQTRNYLMTLFSEVVGIILKNRPIWRTGDTLAL